MINARSLAAFLALSGVAALPACSMFQGDDAARTSSSRSVGASGQSYAGTPSYTTDPQAPAVAPPLTPEMVRSVQHTLQQDGLYRGSVDGKWGAGTQAGVRRYQEQHNITATGQLDQPTLTAMNLVPSQNDAQQGTGQRYGSNYNPAPDAAPAPPNPAATPR